MLTIEPPIRWFALSNYYSTHLDNESTTVYLAWVDAGEQRRVSTVRASEYFGRYVFDVSDGYQPDEDSLAMLDLELRLADAGQSPRYRAGTALDAAFWREEKRLSAYV